MTSLHSECSNEFLAKRGEQERKKTLELLCSGLNWKNTNEWNEQSKFETFNITWKTH